jgi:hypothetical protein
MKFSYGVSISLLHTRNISDSIAIAIKLKESVLHASAVWEGLHFNSIKMQRHLFIPML